MTMGTMAHVVANIMETNSKFELMRDWVIKYLAESEGLVFVPGPLEKEGDRRDTPCAGFVVTFQTKDFGSCQLCALTELLTTRLVVDDGVVYVVQYDKAKEQDFYEKADKRITVKKPAQMVKAMKAIEGVLADGKAATFPEIVSRVVLETKHEGFVETDPFAPAQWCIGPDYWSSTDDTMSCFIEFWN